MPTLADAEAIQTSLQNGTPLTSAQLIQANKIGVAEGATTQQANDLLDWPYSQVLINWLLQALVNYIKSIKIG
jgi:hypothetical protein